MINNITAEWGIFLQVVEGSRARRCHDKSSFVSLFTYQIASVRRWQNGIIQRSIDSWSFTSTRVPPEGSLLIFDRQLKAAHPSNLITYGTTLRENEKPRR